MGGRRSTRQLEARLRSRLPAIVALALIALSFFIYAPALHGEFVSDDVNAIVANEHVRGPLDPAGLFTRMSWWGSARGDTPGYRPLTTLTFALNHELGGLEPAGYHSVNVLLHALVSWLLFLVARRIGLDDKAAVLSAILFCVLPIHSEAVAWIVGRAELLAAATYLTAILALLTYRERGKAVWLAVAVFMMAAGLLSKENVVTLLAVPAATALCFPAPPAARRRDGYAALALAVTLAVYLAIRAAVGAEIPEARAALLDNPLSMVDYPGRLIGVLSVFGRYLWLTLWPWPLSIDYSYNALGIGPGFRGDAFSLLGLVAAGMLGGYAWFARERQPAATFAILLTVIAYSIVSNAVVLIGTIMGERLFYLPSAGLCMLAGAILTARGRLANDTARKLLAFATTAFVVMFSIVTVARAADWKTRITIFEAAARAHPESARAHMELGTSYGTIGRREEGRISLLRSIAIFPEYAAAWMNLGNLHANAGEYDAAVEAYTDAVTANPRLIPAWYNLGLAERLRGNPEGAVRALNEATERGRLDPMPPAALGDVLLGLGRNEEAMDAFSEAIERGTRDPAVFINRGVAGYRLSGCASVIEDYLTAVRLAPADRTAAANAVNCLEFLGRSDEAAVMRAQVANRRLGG